MLIIHIIIACAGLLVGTYNFIKPRRSRVFVNYVLLTATLCSGTYLTISSGSHILSACLSGLVYTAVMLGLQYGARVRLAGQHI